MKNKYEIRGDVTAIFLKSRKYGCMETLISTNKLERVQEYSGSWYARWSEQCQTFYVLGNTPKVNGKQKSILLHRWITNAPTSMEVDHIYHNGLDNTDEHVRVVSASGNQQNPKGAYKNSKSGIRGVCWNKQQQKWRVTIKVNNKYVHVGLFKDIEEAERCAKEARAKYLPFSKEAMSDEYDKSKITLDGFKKKKEMDSGMKGITWRKDGNMWEVRYNKNKKCTRLGYFKTLEAAQEKLKQYKEALSS